MTRVLISFSGGRTSAFMALMLVTLCHYFGIEFIVVFANTGDEDEQTLIFVDRCDREWNLGVVWVEADVNPQRGQGTKHRIVTFETASRNQEPFEAVIEKFGIPNKVFNHCNRELKLRPIHSYARSIGWEPGTYLTAIGIRADEMDRMSAAADEEGWIYPLVKAGITKPFILAFFYWTQAFDLYLAEEDGNCKACHKKSRRKLLTVAKKDATRFSWRTRMEAEHPFAGAGDGPRRFYREGWTTLDILARSRLPFEPFVDTNFVKDPALDEAEGCSESCDVFGDQADELRAARELFS